MTLTQQDVAAMVKRAEAATPGPWPISDDTINGRIMSIGPICGYDFDALECRAGDPDAVFISHARDDLPALAAALESAMAALRDVCHPDLLPSNAQWDAAQSLLARYYGGTA